MNANTPQRISLIARWSGNRLVYSTKLSVLPKHWNGKSYEVRNIIHEPNKDSINNHLKDLKAETIRIYTDLLEKREIVTSEKIKERLDDFTKRNDKPEKHFWGFVDNFIMNAPRRMTKKGQLISNLTVQKYKIIADTLRDFERETRRHIDFENINASFYNDLTEYLAKVKKLKVNTIGGHIATLLLFLREASIAGVAEINMETIKRSFKVLTEDTTAVYLSMNELEALYNLDLSQNSRLDRARDLFLIGCHTGLRVSDFTNIQPHNIRGDFIKLFQTKTGGLVVIPIHDTVKAILNKYSGNTPPKISDQKLNNYIKEICKLAGFTDQIETQATKGGLRKSEVLKKWELITNHTARRSFATNMYKMGIPAQTIMKITGHKKESVFLRYIKLSEQEHADIMKESWKKDANQKADILNQLK